MSTGETAVRTPTDVLTGGHLAELPLGELAELPLGELGDHYDRLDLDRLSDAELVTAVSAVIADPRQPPGNSFVLHAPLELAARAALLPLVEPKGRRAARVRLLVLAAKYSRHTPLTPATPADRHRSDESTENPSGSAHDPISDLLEMVAAGDADGAEQAAARAAGRLSSRSLADRLGPAVVASTAAAAHAPIFLHHLVRRDRNSGITADLLRPLSRSLAANPDWRIRWTDGWSPPGQTDPDALAHGLGEVPLLGPPGSSFIHPLIMQVDESGIAEQHLASVVGGFNPEAGRELLRIAARMMLTDNPEEAPYGWTHCLTIPQAVLSVTAKTDSADLGLAIAATQVAAFRAGLGTEPLDRPELIEPGPRDVSRLATMAADTHDAHVVKYVLACIDGATDDPAARALYLNAAQRLFDVWAEQGGNPDDPLA